MSFCCVLTWPTFPPVFTTNNITKYFHQKYITLLSNLVTIRSLDEINLNSFLNKICTLDKLQNNYLLVKLNFKDICHSWHLKMWQWTGKKALFRSSSSEGQVKKDEWREGVTFKAKTVKTTKALWRVGKVYKRLYLEIYCAT